MVELRVDGGAPGAAIEGIIQVFRGSTTMNGLVDITLRVQCGSTRLLRWQHKTTQAFELETTGLN